MQNFDTAIKATATSLNSAGSAEKENEKVMQGLEKTIQKLKAQFEILINGDGGLKTFMVSVVKLGANTLKLINTLGGLPTVLMGILSVLLLIKGEAITKMILDAKEAIPKLISSLANLKVAYSTTGKSIKIFSSDVATASSTLHASIPIIGLVVTGITLLTGVINKHKQAEAEAEEKRQEHIKTLESEIKGIEDAQSKIESENLSRQELINLLDANIDGYDKEQAKLKGENELRREAVKLLDEELKKKAQQYRLSSEKERQDAVKTLTKSYESEDVFGKKNKGLFGKQQGTNLAEAKNIDERIRQYEVAIETISNKAELEETDEYNNLLKKLSANYADLVEEKEKAETVSEELAYYAKLEGQVYDKLTGTYRKMTDEEREGYEASKKTTTQIKEEGKWAKWSDEVWQEYAEDTGQSVEEAMASLMGLDEAIEDVNEDTKSFADYASDMSFDNTTLDGLHDAFTKLNDALKEVNEEGSLSYDNFNALMSLGDEYIGVIFDEEGHLRDLAEVQDEVYKAKAQMMALEKAQMLLDVASKYHEEAGSMAGLQEELRKTTNLRWSDIDAQIAQMKLQAEADKQIAYFQKKVRNGVADTKAELKKQLSEGSLDMDALSSTFGESWTDNAKADARIDKMYNESMADIEALEEMISVTHQKADEADHWNETQEKGSGKAKEAIKKEDDALKELENDYKDAVKEIKDAINKEIDKIKEAKDTEINAIKDRISALEKQKDKEIKAVEDRIKALQKARDAEEKYWDDKIDALKAQNKEQERQNELMKLEEELAKARAKNVMVLGESGHFELRKDDTEVQKAEEALEKKQEEIAYEKKLEELENYKQQALANYDAQIADLESYKDKLEENYNAQIEALKAFQDEREKYYDQQTEALKAQLDELQSSLEDYVDIENKKAEAGADATNSEAKTWNQRLSNLADFVNKYNSLMKKLGDGSTNNKGGGLGTSYSADAISSGNKKEVKGKKATGDSYISEDGAYLVGDDPNKEIIIGSKLNGSLMSLSKGSGVVNAKSTNTLAGVLNQLGSFSRSNFGSGNGTLVNNSNSNAQNITIGSISLPEVKNGKDFVDYLQNFSLNMKQMSFA